MTLMIHTELIFIFYEFTNMFLLDWTQVSCTLLLTIYISAFVTFNIVITNNNFFRHTVEKIPKYNCCKKML